jgi:hypothetical protein
VPAQGPPVLAQESPVLAQGGEIQTTHHPLKVSFPLRLLAEPARPQAQVEHHPESAWEREQARANHREQEQEQEPGRVRMALGRGRHREPVARWVVAVGPRS